MRGWCALGMLLLLSLMAAAQTGVRPWQADLRLYGAAFSGETQDPDWPVLVFELERTGDRWERVYVMTNDYSRIYEAGRVTGARQYGDRQGVDIAVNFRRTRGGGGAYGEYKVAFTVSADGKIAGEYTGAFRGVPIKGKVEGAVVDRTGPTAAGYVPVQAGEHPRILFRKQDLPALRKKLETPLGQALLPKMDGPVGLGLKYQLTGDQSCPAAAVPLVDKLMARGLFSNQYGDNMERTAQVALAYDMFYDVWPADYRRTVEHYLAWIMKSVLYAPGNKTNGGINWNVCSNWSAPIYTGAGFAGLALWGEKGARPEEPLAPPPATIAPVAGKVATGVPVFPFQDGVMPGEWLFAGGFVTMPGDDPLAALGGPAKCFPAPGQQVSFGGKTAAFSPLSHEKDKGYATSPTDNTRTMIDITGAAGRTMFTTNYFYCVADNDAERWVQVNTDYTDAAVYLAGVRVSDGDCVKLAPGQYPMLVVATFDYTLDWVRALMRPRLTVCSEAEAQASRAVRQQAYGRERAAWQYDVAEWQRLGGQNVDYLTLGEQCKRMLYLFCREAVGTGGEQAEIAHYGNIAYAGPARFSTAYRVMFGRDVSPYNDITWVMPRKIFQHFYGVDGRDAVQEINSDPKIYLDGWGGHYASGFFAVPDQWKPVVLWAWNRDAKVSGDNPVGDLAKCDPVWTFLFYPLEMEPKHPKEVMPLTWQAPDFGLYGFRNSWEGRDDAILQVWLRAHPVGGWNGPNAGTFRLYGLGHVWAWGPTDRNRFRWEENVVQLPENPEITENALGHLRYLKSEADGSGSLTIDMNDVYATAAEAKAQQYSRYGNFRRAAGFADSGISGLRAVAVDYSGLSGAPCLLVLVDQITGGHTKVWTWNLERGDGKRVPGDVERTKVDGRTFTIAKEDASLRGTFIAPAAMALTAEVKAKSMTGGAGSSAGRTLDRPIPGVFAESQDGRFFCVVTLQRGPAPEVQVTGIGLDALVTVGKRTIRFDGEKILFGTK